MSKESTEDFKALKEFYKEQHDKHRAENFDIRLQYAIDQFNKEEISFKLCNQSIGHFNLLKDNKTIVSFWCYTGAIYSSFKKTNRENIRGIKHVIKLYKELI